MINFTNNKKLNIKINILLAAFLEDEFYDIEVCLDEINKSLQENKSISIIVDKGFYTISYNALVASCKSILAYILTFIMKKDFNKVADIIKNNNAADGATFINKFINENETYYDVKNVIEAAIKNSDIDIEKLCESLNL